MIWESRKKSNVRIRVLGVRVRVSGEERAKPKEGKISGIYHFREV